MTQSLKTIFQRISVKSNVPYDQFFKEITHRECNDQLVSCTQFMDKVDKSLDKQKKYNNKNLKQQVLIHLHVNHNAIALDMRMGS